MRKNHEFITKENNKKNKKTDDVRVYEISKDMLLSVKIIVGNVVIFHEHKQRTKEIESINKKMITLVH